jgi:hypothetical protein
MLAIAITLAAYEVLKALLPRTDHPASPGPAGGVRR